MTCKEAYECVHMRYPSLNFVRCIEYSELFVFQLFSEKDVILFDSEISINKNTKEIKDFKPFYISLFDYQNGTEIFNFKGE